MESIFIVVIAAVGLPVIVRLLLELESRLAGDQERLGADDKRSGRLAASNH